MMLQLLNWRGLILDFVTFVIVENIFCDWDSDVRNTFLVLRNFRYYIYIKGNFLYFDVFMEFAVLIRRCCLQEFRMDKLSENHFQLFTSLGVNIRSCNY